MDYCNEIISILIKLFAVFVVVYLIPKFTEFLNNQIGAEESATLEKYIQDFVLAADQLYKSEDPSGEKRNAYVKEKLEKLGYVISDLINAKIEAEVLKLGHKK